MNEEEKKAIEGLFHLAHINGYIDLEKNNVIHISRPLIEEWKDETKILLNLIEKQQKEIKKLNDKLKEERDFNKSALETLKECVHKDTIKKKIDLIDKEYAELIEKNKNDLYLVNINAQRHNAMQTILEELLGGTTK